MSISEQTLLQVVSRLENLCKNLESNKGSVSTQLLTTENIAAFTDYWNKTLNNLVNLRTASVELKNEDIDKITDIVCEAICAQQDILLASETFKKPVNADQQSLIKKVSSIWSKLPEISKGKKDIINHCDAAKNGLDAIFWIFSESMCDQVCQTYLEQIDFPGNRILSMKQPLHTKWLNLFKSLIKELNELVKKNYKLGLTWNAKGDTDVSKLLITIGNTYRKNFKSEETVIDLKQEYRNKLFEEISNDNARKGLKPTGKTEEKKDEPHPLLAFDKNKSKSSKSDHKGRRQTITKKGKQEKFEEGKSHYFFENIEGEQRELNDKLENKSIIQISNCSDSSFKIPKKINAIKLTNCENIKIYCESLITMFEITNSIDIYIDVTGVVNAFSVDSSKHIVFYITKLSSQAQFITSKSTDVFINLRDEKDNQNYKEFALPEQFVFNLNNGKLEAKVSDLYS